MKEYVRGVTLMWGNEATAQSRNPTQDHLDIATRHQQFSKILAQTLGFMEGKQMCRKSRLFPFQARPLKATSECFCRE